MPEHTDRPAADTDLPPSLASMWRMVRLGLAHEPRLLMAATVLVVLAAVPDALLALWLKLLGDGVAGGNRSEVLLAALGLAASTTGTWVLNVASVRVQRSFRDRVSIALEAHVARLQATVPSIAHQERPELLDRLSVLRNSVFVLDHLYYSLLNTLAWVIRLGLTAVLLATVSPVLLLIGIAALPTVLAASWRPGVERRTEEAAAPRDRLARHLFTTLTTAGPAMQVRVLGVGPRLAQRRRAEWEAWYAPVSRARWGSAVWQVLGWAVFGLTYVAGIVWVAAGLHRSAGDVLLVLAAGGRLSGYIAATIGEIGFLRGIWLDGSRRLVWLERYAAALAARADTAVPDRLRDGIRLEQVSFAYPGTDRLVLDDVSLHLPAGAVIAVVGENGAGKSTLVKLLTKMYEPTSGEISLDGAPLSRMDARQWRERTAGSFQDHARFEFAAQHSVGLGDLPVLDDRPAVLAAVGRAGAEDVVRRLDAGLDTQLGTNWPGGVDLSGGQWQKVALARGFVRERPLLLVLDEPTAALDAETEHALFGRYAAAARTDDGTGRVTVLISHRFSTVRTADLIVVLDGSRVREVGSHAQLIAAGGTYAELYGIQAAAYS